MKLNNNIPRRTRAYARLWAIKYIASHPNWRHEDGDWDSWLGTDGHDLNIVVTNDGIKVVAYPISYDDMGAFVTDYSSPTVLVDIPNKENN